MDEDIEFVEGEEEITYALEGEVVWNGEKKWSLIKACFTLEDAFDQKAFHSKNFPDVKYRVVEIKTVEMSWIREIKEH